MSHVPMTDQCRSAVNRLVEQHGRGVTMNEILSEWKPIVGFEREFRDVVLTVTKVDDWTDFGDPLRVVDEETNR